MVRTVERIEQELAILDQAVEKLAQDFREVYGQYLAALGQAVKQQLILATYHLCTQGYPERFLSLSLHQRQELQQSLRHLTQQSQQQFLEMLNASQRIEYVPPRRRSAIGAALFELSQIDLGEASLNENGELELLTSELSADDLTDMRLAALDLSKADLTDLPETNLAGADLEESDGSNSPDETHPADTDQETDPIQSASQEGSSPSPDDQAESLTVAELLQEGMPADRTEESDRPQGDSPPVEADPSQTDSPPDPKPLHPKQLALWQEQLEENIVEELQNLSHTVNRLLQQSQILPARLPEPVLEVAAKADLATEASSSPPNLLNLIIETETEEPKESTTTQLMAVRLRLSEIEFSDSSTMIWRSKVRELLAQLNKLGREYQNKQKERSVAQAEAAWRSSWYDEKS
ncbi:pentapeptide repeat-containing protein [Egbenema bharatensis]|uniref:pentapeptide repeat-containing protein n=1 Tax=Egbenema bharatensis TaxID=3463334 RepID=UPI003A884823